MFLRNLTQLLSLSLASVLPSDSVLVAMCDAELSRPLIGQRSHPFLGPVGAVSQSKGGAREG